MDCSIQENMMSEEKNKPEDHDEDRPEVEEVVTEFGDIRLRSGFEIDQHEPGVLGINLFGPIFEFYKNIRRVEIEEAKTKEVLHFYENTVLTAFREVDDALIEINTYRNQMVAVGRKEKADRNAHRLAKLRYDKGVSSYLEVLETERALFSAQLELSGLKQEYLNGYVKLYKALGGGWTTKDDMNKAKEVSPKRS